MKSVGAYLGCPTGSEVPDGRCVRKSSAVPHWNLTVFSKGTGRAQPKSVALWHAPQCMRGSGS